MLIEFVRTLKGTHKEVKAGTFRGPGEDAFNVWHLYERAVLPDLPAVSFCGQYSPPSGVDSPILSDLYTCAQCRKVAGALGWVMKKDAGRLTELSQAVLWCLKKAPAGAYVQDLCAVFKARGDYPPPTQVLAYDPPLALVGCDAQDIEDAARSLFHLYLIDSAPESAEPPYVWRLYVGPEQEERFADYQLLQDVQRALARRGVDARGAILREGVSIEVKGRGDLQELLGALGRVR